MAEVAATKDVLRKRVRRLLRLDRDEDDQSELRTRILPFLQSLGEVALIGGAIRDLARAGRGGFASDLDFVVHGSSGSKFRETIGATTSKPNRFGGYALKFYHWKVDVWHLEDTWARTAGLRRVEQLSDLLRCTFFDWDAVVYDLRSGQLTFDEGYLLRLKAGVMDVRLAENPNPGGSLVRALRRAALWGVRFGPHLSDFSSRYLSALDWDDLVKTDRAAFGSPVLAHLDREELMRRLLSVETVLGQRSSLPVPNWRRQPMLPFSHPDGTDLSPGSLTKVAVGN